MRIPTKRTWAVSLVAVALGFTGVRAAAAQQINEMNDRPERALFGSGLANVAQSLSFDGNLAGGLEQVLVTSSTETPRELGMSGVASGAAGLSYALDVSHVAFNAHAGSFARYARAYDRPSIGHDASASVATEFALSSRVRGSVEASAGYQPASVLNLFPDMFQDQSAPDILVGYQFDGPLEHYVSTAAAAGLTYGLSSRSNLSVAYQYSESNGLSAEGSQSYQSLSAGFSHTIARGLALRLGYGRRLGRYGADENADTFKNHDIDAGVDFNRSLSVSRRTTLTFSTGTTFVTDGVNERYDFVGSASLGHQVGRDWSTAVSYNRNVEFVEVVTQPVFSDSFVASVEGLIGRRLSMHFAAGASFGNVGVSTDAGNGYNAYQAAASMQTALSRYMGVTFGYVYYDYSFDGRDFLPDTIRQRDRRHTAHVSVDLFLPLFQRGTRSTNAAR